jgi:flagellar hook assembly protein FlgD
MECRNTSYNVELVIAVDKKIFRRVSILNKQLRNLILGITALTLIPSTLAFAATNARPVISEVTATPAITKQVTQPVSLKFKVSETSKVSINIYKSGKLVKNGMNKVRKGKGLVTYIWTGTKSNGVYTIKIDASDLSGLNAVTKSLSVNVDTVKPVISSVVTDLDTNYMANGDEVNFLVKVLESSTINVRVYGGTYPNGYTIYNKFCNAGENELTWNGKFGSLIAKDGAYNVVFTAIDKAGNVSATNSVVITKDSVAPVIKTSGFAKDVFNPAKGSNNFSFTASEPVQFLLLVSPKNSDPLLNPVFGGPQTEPAYATSGILGWDGKKNITEPFTQVPDGEYVYRLLIMDKAGNISSVDAPVKVDTANPTITEANIPTTFVTTGSNNTEMSFKINEAGIAKVVVVKENEGVETVVKTLLDGNKAAGLQTVQWDGKDNNNQIVAPGAYKVKITLTDAAGNQADGVTGNVEIIDAAIQAIAAINAGTEVFADFATAGVTGAVEANKAAYDTAIAAAKATKGSDLTLTEVQAEVAAENTAAELAAQAAAQAAALATINAGTEVFADFTTAGVTGAVEANKVAYDTAIAAAKATKGSDLTLIEVQAEVDAENTI